MDALHQYLDAIAKLGNSLSIQPIDTELVLGMNSLTELYLTLHLLAIKQKEKALSKWYAERGRGDPATHDDPFVFEPKSMWDDHEAVDSTAKIMVLERLSFSTVINDVKHDFHVDRRGVMDIRVTPIADDMCLYLTLDFLHGTVHLIHASDSLSGNPHWLTFLWKIDSAALGDRIRKAVEDKSRDSRMFASAEFMRALRMNSTMPEGLRGLDKFEQATAEEFDWK